MNGRFDLLFKKKIKYTSQSYPLKVFMWESFQINMLIKASCLNLSESLPEPEAHLTDSEMLKLKMSKIWLQLAVLYGSQC